MRPGARRRRPCRAVPAPRRMHAPGAAPIAGRRRAAEAPEPRRRPSQATPVRGDTRVGGTGPPPRRSLRDVHRQHAIPREQAGGASFPARRACRDQDVGRGARKPSPRQPGTFVRARCRWAMGPEGCRIRCGPDMTFWRRNNRRMRHGPLAHSPPGHDCAYRPPGHPATILPLAIRHWPPGHLATRPRFRHLAGCHLATISPLAIRHWPPGHDCATGYSAVATWPRFRHVATRHSPPGRVPPAAGSGERRGGPRNK
jgi:hypothetical protein